MKVKIPTTIKKLDLRTEDKKKQAVLDRMWDWPKPPQVSNALRKVEG